ncbi:MAG TPA: flagellar export protein FliJ [Casimicrobiaceae bacterium]|nr:flagellar export protein FliJ [Casimicrobiaceae bacterium]
MKIAPPWNRLKDVAAKRRDESAQRLADAQRARDEAQKKLDTLLGYRAEYESRLASTAGKGIDAMTLRNYRTFLSQLDRAVHQQRDALTLAQHDMDRATQAWVADHKRTETYQLLDDRSLEAEAAVERRTEQKQVDEWVTQKHHRRTTNPR